MSRYIDADAIHWHDDGWACIRKDEYPSIDIVRCKECKYAHMTYGGDCKYCDMWKDDEDGCIELYLDGDFYCAYGERTPSIGMTAGTSFDVKADDFCSYGEREGE